MELFSLKSKFLTTVFIQSKGEVLDAENARFDLRGDVPQLFGYSGIKGCWLKRFCGKRASDCRELFHYRLHVLFLSELLRIAYVLCF